MLNNLKAEYVRKGVDPTDRIMSILNCSEKTARNKLTEKTPITVAEAKKIRDTDFESFTLDYLFAICRILQEK